jgi:TetR/AcrR family transcriptional repressor of nem operon
MTNIISLGEVMRYKEDHKEQTHRRIVERASQEYRAHGFDGMGIAKLMSLLDLTHGGFYAHFKDKEDLKNQAMEFAFEKSIEIAVEALERGGILAYIEHYTSDLHRDHPEFGCALASLAGEEGRRSAASRARFARQYDEGVDVVAQYMPGATQDQKTSRAHFLLASLSGAVALARAAGDPAISAEILSSAREELSRYFRSL